MLDSLRVFWRNYRSTLRKSCAAGSAQSTVRRRPCAQPCYGRFEAVFRLFWARKVYISFAYTLHTPIRCAKLLATPSWYQLISESSTDVCVRLGQVGNANPPDPDLLEVVSAAETICSCTILLTFHITFRANGQHGHALWTVIDNHLLIGFAFHGAQPALPAIQAFQRFQLSKPFRDFSQSIEICPSSQQG